jgi:hypothetical protein
LNAIEEKVRSESRYVCTTIGHLGVVIAQVNGCKKAENKWFNAVSQQLDYENAIAFINPRSAAVLMELYNDRKVPEWVTRSGLVDLDIVRLACA